MSRSYAYTRPPTQPCWHCRNYAGGCSWTQKEPKPVDGWRAVPTRKSGDSGKIMHSFEIRYCPEFVSDGTEGYGAKTGEL